MDIIVHHIARWPLEVLDNARAFHDEGSIAILFEVLNEGPDTLDVGVFASGKDTEAGLAALADNTLEGMLPGECRPVRLCLTQLDSRPIVSVLIGAYRTIPTCRGTQPTRPEGTRERGDV